MNNILSHIPRKMPKKLAFGVFLKTFKYAPRLAVNLLIENKEGAILLSKRAQPPFVGYWHLPGGFLLKGERLLECVARIAEDELGLKLKNKKMKFLGIFEDIDKDPRGHVLDIVYLCQLKSESISKPPGEAKEIRFFQKIPSKIGFNHKEILNCLLQNLHS